MTDSKAETTNTQPASASSGQHLGWRRMCSTLIVQSKVRSGWRSCIAATTRRACRGALRKSGSAKRHVPGAGGHQLVDVGHDGVLGHGTDPPVVDDRHRAVPAAVRAAPAGLHRTDESLLAGDGQLGVAIQGRQQVAAGHPGP